MRTVLEARQQRGLDLASAPFPNGNLSAIAQTMKPMEASASTSLLFSIFSNSIYLIPM